MQNRIGIIFATLGADRAGFAAFLKEVWTRLDTVVTFQGELEVGEVPNLDLLFGWSFGFYGGFSFLKIDSVVVSDKTIYVYLYNMPFDVEFAQPTEPLWCFKGWEVSLDGLEPGDYEALFCYRLDNRRLPMTYSDYPEIPGGYRLMSKIEFSIPEGKLRIVRKAHDKLQQLIR
ncbi:MAG: hypothetical protein ABH878_01215 [bacterium]